MILESLYIGHTAKMGRGVFTNENINENIIIEISPVLVLGKEDRKLLDLTLLHNYIFEWGNNSQQCCIAMGYVMLYNHSYQSNCEYEMNYDEEIMTIKTVRFVKAGEELFINYNGDCNNKKPLWFEAV